MRVDQQRCRQSDVDTLLWVIFKLFENHRSELVRPQPFLLIPLNGVISRNPKQTKNRGWGSF
jgi:hypothetical protein